MEYHYIKNDVKIVNDPRWLKLIKKPINPSKNENRFGETQRKTRAQKDGTTIELPDPTAEQSCIDCLIDGALPENPTVKDIINARERSSTTCMIITFILVIVGLFIVLCYGRTIRTWFTSRDR